MPKKTLLTLAFLPMAMISLPITTSAAALAKPATDVAGASAAASSSSSSHADGVGSDDAVALWASAGLLGALAMTGYGLTVARLARPKPAAARTGLVAQTAA